VQPWRELQWRKFHGDLARWFGRNCSHCLWTSGTASSGRRSDKDRGRQCGGDRLGKKTAVDIDNVILQAPAPQFGIATSEPAYLLKFRNPKLRLLILYSDKGMDGVRNEVQKLRVF
jgi:hypothetical protein